MNGIQALAVSVVGAVVPIWLPWYLGVGGVWRTVFTATLIVLELVVGILLTWRALRLEDDRFFEAERIRIEQDQQPGSPWVTLTVWERAALHRDRDDE